MRKLITVLTALLMVMTLFTLATSAQGNLVTAIITGDGFTPGTGYDIPLIRPDGSLVKGDGSSTPGWDTVQVDSEGSFTYLYQLNGLAGTYQVRLYPSPWTGDLSEAPLASTTFLYDEGTGVVINEDAVTRHSLDVTLDVLSSPPSVQSINASAVIVDNPPLSQSCGLDIALVIDGSGSIEPIEYSQMQAALVDFVDAFLPGTPTQFALVEFATSAVVRQGFTDDATVIKNEINDNREQPDGVLTNWDDGLFDARNLFPNRDNPDLIVFASDGNPNIRGGHEGNPLTLVTESLAMEWAIEEANAVKSAGIRLITIGIGSSLDTNNLAAISSADAVITSDFDQIANDLATLAAELCGGTINVHKIIDGDGNLTTTEDQSDGQGWHFEATVANGSAISTPANGDTDNEGFVVFDIDLADPSTPATVDIEETKQGDFDFLAASCTNQQGDSIGTPGANVVTGISISPLEIISCQFYNTQHIQTAFIDLEKRTNGNDADTIPGPNIPRGDPVIWTYEIRNTGSELLTHLSLSDDQIPALTCAEGPFPTTLNPGDSFTCTTSGVAALGQYENTATVTAEDLKGNQVSDIDQSHYFGIDPTNWSFECVTHRMEVTGIGMGNFTTVINPQSLALPDPARVNWLLVQMSGRALLNNGAFLPNSITFSTDAPQIKVLATPSSFAPSFGYAYEITVRPTSLISVAVDGVGNVGTKTPRALVLYSNRNVDLNLWTSVGRTTNGFVWHGFDLFSHTEVLDLPPLPQTTDLMVTAVVIDNNDDSRPMVVEATTGGISSEVTELGPTEGDLLNIVNLTLKDVPEGTNAVTVTLRSPRASNGDSLTLVGLNARYFCDADLDGDGIPKHIETEGDPDGDNVPNYLDTDSDGDGILDQVEWNSDADGDGQVEALDRDADGDGLYNFLDLNSDDDSQPDSEEGLADDNNNGILDFLEPDQSDIYLPIIAK